MTATSCPHLYRLLRAIKFIEDSALIALLAAMIGVAVGQILMRNVLGAGFAWGDPLLRILVLWVGLAGAIVATREDNHISINVLTRFLPTRFQTISRMLTDIFAAIVCGVIAYYAGWFVVYEFEAETIAFASVPTWVCQTILPFAFTVMSVRFLALAASRRTAHDSETGLC